MKQKFTKSWKSSKQPRKQRKYRHNAPLHIKSKFMAAHLSQDLKKEYKKRSITLRKGDSVKILRGQFKSRTGKIDRVNLKKTKVYITGIETTKKDGTKIKVYFSPSNLQIQELDLEDKKRRIAIERGRKETKVSLTSQPSFN